jgi:hypothetical protein
MLRDLWGRMVSCGRVVLGLVGICILVGRPSATRPQVANLPHISSPNLEYKYARIPSISNGNRRDAHFYVAHPAGIDHLAAGRAIFAPPRVSLRS